MSQVTATSQLLLPTVYSSAPLQNSALSVYPSMDCSPQLPQHPTCAVIGCDLHRPRVRGLRREENPQNVPTPTAMRPEWALHRCNHCTHSAAQIHSLLQAMRWRCMKRCPLRGGHDDRGRASGRRRGIGTAIDDDADESIIDNKTKWNLPAEYCRYCSELEPYRFRY